MSSNISGEESRRRWIKCHEDARTSFIFERVAVPSTRESTRVLSLLRKFADSITIDVHGLCRDLLTLEHHQTTRNQSLLASSFSNYWKHAAACLEELLNEFIQ